MSTPQRSESSALVDAFKGTDWKECNDFIRAIRASAWKEGKQRDMAWMADYAALHFSHGALFWHSRLLQDVRQDWGKLETALLERWPPPEAFNESGIQPTPAAAPSGQPNNLNADHPLQGVLKVIANQSNEIFYAKFQGSICILTHDVTQALRVRCSPLGESVRLERIDGSSHSWLGLGWWSQTPNLGKGSREYCNVIMVTSDEVKPSTAGYAAWQIMTCRVSANREISPTWGIGTQRFTLGILAASGDLRLAADPETFTDGENASMFIEAVV